MSNELLTRPIKKAIQRLVFANRSGEEIINLLKERMTIRESDMAELERFIFKIQEKKSRFGQFLWVMGILLFVMSLIVVVQGVYHQKTHIPWIDLFLAGYMIYLGHRFKKIRR